MPERFVASITAAFFITIISAIITHYYTSNDRTNKQVMRQQVFQRSTGAVLLVIAAIAWLFYPYYSRPWQVSLLGLYLSVFIAVIRIDVLQRRVYRQMAAAGGLLSVLLGLIHAQAAQMLISSALALVIFGFVYQNGLRYAGRRDGATDGSAFGLGDAILGVALAPPLVPASISYYAVLFLGIALATAGIKIVRQKANWRTVGPIPLAPALVSAQLIVLYAQLAKII